MTSQQSIATTTSIKQAMDVALNQVLQSNFDADSIVCCKTLLKILDNLIKEPTNPKVRTIKASNPTIQQKILQTQGLGVLQACGFSLGSGGTEITLPDSHTTSDHQQQLAMIQQARTMICHVLIHELKVDAAELPPIPVPPPLAPPPTTLSFDVYQPQRYDGTSAAVGTNLGAPKGWKSHTELQLEALRQKQQQLEQTIAKNDRQWKAYRTASSSTTTTTVGTTNPVEMTTSDSALLAAQITKKQQERQVAETQGFTTKAMRDLEALKKSKVYSHAHLRIHFADGSVVAGNFGPKETCATVLAALQSEVLVGPCAKIPMELYMTPPRTVLDPTKTLQELQLVPAAKIFVKWMKSLQPPPNGSTSSSEKGWFIRQDLFQESPTIGDMPQAIAVVDAWKEAQAATTTGSTAGTTLTAAKRKPTKEEKEAALLKRMMGKK